MKEICTRGDMLYPNQKADKTTTFYQRSLSFFEREKYSQAYQCIDAAINGSDDPEPEFFFQKAKILFNCKGREQEAIELMKNIENISLQKKETFNRKSRYCRTSLVARSLYYVGLWSFLTEDDKKCIEYLKRYLQEAALHPSYKLPTRYAKKNLYAAEAALIDEDCKKTNSFVNKGQYTQALEIVESVVSHAGIGMCDHWILALGAKAYYATEKYSKARKYARQAFLIEPECADTALVYGIANSHFHSSKSSEEAFRVFRMISQMPLKKIASGRCAHGTVTAVKIKLKAMLFFGVLCGKKGDLSAAVKHLKSYIKTSTRYEVGGINEKRNVISLINAVESHGPNIRTMFADRLKMLAGKCKDSKKRTSDRRLKTR